MIKKNIRRGIEAEAEAHRAANAAVGRDDESIYVNEEYIQELEAEMLAAAENLEFERAGIIQVKKQIGKEITETELKAATQQAQTKRRKGKRSVADRVPKPKK